MTVVTLLASDPVSILTRPEGRVQPPSSSDGPTDMGVSILTRPEGRVQRLRARRSCIALNLFQSSPGPKAGCNHRTNLVRSLAARVSILTRPEGRVQPHPVVNLDGFVLVSILTRPEGRVQPSWIRCGDRSPGPVSILTRPEGRVQLGDDRSWHGGAVGVSILTRPEGRVQPARSGISRRLRTRFNPHPARRPGATSRGGGRAFQNEL